jgi:ribosomal-protein-alanine N-acetyltransferase
MAQRRVDVTIRPWAPGDEKALCQLANNRRVWRNLTDRFPHPYELADALDWVANANEDPHNACHFAVLVGDELAGGVGFERLEDLSRRTAEIGYWVGEPFWGGGVATAALTAATAHAFAHYDFVRLQATVLEWNPASCRVLEKAGYSLEGRLRSRGFKDGEICDQLIYAMLRPSRSAV